MSVFQVSKAYKIVAADAARGELSHAYLFVCPDARNLRGWLLELAVLIAGGDGRVSDLIRREMYADCRVMPAPGGKLTVADVRDLVDDCCIRPIEGDKKIYVLDNAQDMNAAAQNKLLKVLEEPPANVYFLLGATNEYPVLPTVRSRTKKLELSSFSDGEIEKYIREKYPARDDAEKIAAVSGGIVGRAEELAEGGSLAAKGEELALLAMNLTVASAVSASKKYADKSEADAFLSVLRLVYRDILMLKLGRGRNLLSGGEERVLRKAAGRYTAAALVNAQEKIAETERNLKFNANLSVSLETLLIAILEGR